MTATEGLRALSKFSYPLWIVLVAFPLLFRFGLKGLREPKTKDQTDDRNRPDQG